MVPKKNVEQKARAKNLEQQFPRGKSNVNFSKGNPCKFGLCNFSDLAAKGSLVAKRTLRFEQVGKGHECLMRFPPVISSYRPSTV